MTARKRWHAVTDAPLSWGMPREEAATYLLLGCHLNERWATDGVRYEGAGRCVLRSMPDWYRITGEMELEAAIAVLKRLADFLDHIAATQPASEFTPDQLVIFDTPGCITLTWRNWSEMQNYPRPSPARVRPQPGPYAQDTTDPESGPSQSGTGPDTGPSAPEPAPAAVPAAEDAPAPEDAHGGSKGEAGATAPLRVEGQGSDPGELNSVGSIEWDPEAAASESVECFNAACLNRPLCVASRRCLAGLGSIPDPAPAEPLAAKLYAVCPTCGIAGCKAYDPSIVVPPDAYDCATAAKAGVLSRAEQTWADASPARRREILGMHPERPRETPKPKAECLPGCELDPGHPPPCVRDHWIGERRAGEWVEVKPPPEVGATAPLHVEGDECLAGCTVIDCDHSACAMWIPDPEVGPLDPRTTGRGSWEPLRVPNCSVYAICQRMRECFASGRCEELAKRDVAWGIDPQPVTDSSPPEAGSSELLAAEGEAELPLDPALPITGRSLADRLVATGYHKTDREYYAANGPGDPYRLGPADPPLGSCGACSSPEECIEAEACLSAMPLHGPAEEDRGRGFESPGLSTAEIERRLQVDAPCGCAKVGCDGPDCVCACHGEARAAMEQQCSPPPDWGPNWTMGAPLLDAVPPPKPTRECISGCELEPGHAEDSCEGPLWDEGARGPSAHRRHPPHSRCMAPPGCCSCTCATCLNRPKVCVRQDGCKQAFGHFGDCDPKPKRKAKRAPREPFPEPFPPVFMARLVDWGTRQSPPLSEAQIQHAIGVVGDSSLGGDIRRADWVRCVQGAIRRGWALEGCAPGTDDTLTGLELLEREEAVSPGEAPR